MLVHATFCTCKLRAMKVVAILMLLAVQRLAAQQIDREQWNELKAELKDVLEEVNEVAHDKEFVIQMDANELLRLEHLGENWKFPACSCKEIAERKSNWTSGYYWVRPTVRNTVQLIYCELEREFEGTLGWTRVAHLDMTTQYECPRYLKLLTPGSIRLCGKSRDGPGCDSVSYYTFGLTYQKVCGRAVGFQGYTPDGFHSRCPAPCTINSYYVDGLSITYRSSDGFRKHIWTYSAYTAGDPPAFIGDDYYCESGHTGPTYNNIHLGDKLWDGQTCYGEGDRCCGIPEMPWFCTTLPEPTTSSIEVRWCTDEVLSNEDVPIELVELFVY